MKQRHLFTGALLIAISAYLISAAACSKAGGDKIPITTTSEIALNHFLEGRDLFEKLQAQESMEYFEKAVAEDPYFAMAHLFLSFSVPNAKRFFEELDNAVALADQVSEGEKLWILGVQAGTNGYPMQQRELYQQLVTAYPNDERGHTILGNNFFGQQEYTRAIEVYNRAIEINPEYSQTYNQLGYSHRFLENYAEAEIAFRKYIELIPNDPNPHDSYAELLLKMGRYDESIETYLKALEINPNFVASHIGIATNLVLKGNHEEARQQVHELYAMARNDGERRAAHFAATVSYVDEGKPDKALEEQNKQFALARKIHDAANMAGDFVTMGNIYLETGRYDEALEKFQSARETIEGSDLSEDIKNNARRNYLFNSARVALKQGDFETAKTNLEAYRQRVEAINNPFQIRLAHELAGMIALEEKNYDKAIEEFQQANQQNPYNFYRIALAFAAKGEEDKAREHCTKAANFNSLNNLNYAFIKNKALEMLESM
jgi:tetratricopeptide (TPR) repeat protein